MTQQVEHADNILFYIDDNQIIFTDYTQGDNEVDLLNSQAIPSHLLAANTFFIYICLLLMHHGETSNTYTCYKALFNVLTNHRPGNQWPAQQMRCSVIV